MKLLNPVWMMMPTVIRTMSMALRKSIQRHVTGLFARSRWCTRPLTINRQDRRQGTGLLPLSYVVTAVLVASSTPDGVGSRSGPERTTQVVPF